MFVVPDKYYPPESIKYIFLSETGLEFSSVVS